MGSFVYVGNLAPTTLEAAVLAAFAAKGTSPRSVMIMRSSRNDRSRGFGFVELGTEEEVAPAIETMNGVELEGRKLTVGRPRERATRPGADGRSFQSFSGLGGRTGGPRRSGGGSRRPSRS
jgi:cold-inducible RNA-binding protein